MSAPDRATVDMIERLIAFDTTSRNSNLALIDFVRNYLADLGVDSVLTHDETGEKANLYATLGPSETPGVMLSGHTDVVPAEGQDWDCDPFSLEARDGRLYGRGTADMKSFLAVALVRASGFLRRNPRRPLHLAFSYDEEVGCIGVRRLIAQLEDMPVRPASCIVGEPTEMRVVTAHKAKKSVRCRVHGLEAHSALASYGVNAVEAAAEVIAYLRAMARRFRDEGPFDPGFEPPHTTVHTGRIAGGTALNIVPGECAFDFEFRTLPGEDPEDLLAEVRRYAEANLVPEMHAVSPETGFAWEEISGFPGLDTSEEAEVTVFAKALAGANATGKVSFGTEAGLFHEAGIPTVVCGPGSIEQAHRPNEFIALEQVAACERFISRLMDRLCEA